MGDAKNVEDEGRKDLPDPNQWGKSAKEAISDSVKGRIIL